MVALEILDRVGIVLIAIGMYEYISGHEKRFSFAMIVIGLTTRVVYEMVDASRQNSKEKPK